MNPYEAHPSKIPADDPYINEPFYGRYHPQPDDFKPDLQHTLSNSPESIKYWTSVVHQCNASNRLYENDEDGRDVFALGSLIVKSCHLKPFTSGIKASRDYSFADANEVKAVEIARRAFSQAAIDVRVPKIYFAGKIDHRDVLVQERIPGVGLNVAWRYLSHEQKISFKRQARVILRVLRQVQPDAQQVSRGFIVPDPDPVQHRGIQQLEHDILFASAIEYRDRSFMHNDLTTSNTIVNNDKIIGLVDWEMAGWFGLETAGKVHVQIRTPKRENFAQLLARGDLSEEQVQDILFWNDLYDDV